MAKSRNQKRHDQIMQAIKRDARRTFEDDNTKTMIAIQIIDYLKLELSTDRFFSDDRTATEVAENLEITIEMAEEILKALEIAKVLEPLDCGEIYYSYHTRYYLMRINYKAID